jgi:hypothetical protein
MSDTPDAQPQMNSRGNGPTDDVAGLRLEVLPEELTDRDNRPSVAADTEKFKKYDSTRGALSGVGRTSFAGWHSHHST